jgi:ATP-dependent Lhr-like helicase
MSRSYVHADSFTPLKFWREDSGQSRNPKHRLRAKARTIPAGRWECTRPTMPLSPEDRLARAFCHSPLLCRETAGDLHWQEFRDLLTQWEYTGIVRRGYFVSGLSGTQYILTTDYSGVLHSLSHPSPAIVWLNAVDPAQMWGRVLTHEEGRAFHCLPGTAVALAAGEVVAILEKQGQVLRVFQSDLLPVALAACSHAYKSHTLFPQKRRLVLKTYPESAETALQEAGFRKQMREYELWR